MWNRLAYIGPGLAIAATGVGAGDLLAAMAAGADFGAVVLWVIVVGALLKLTVNEGVARWQLATGTTLLEGWSRHLGRPFQVYFLIYLVIWSFIVAGGLMSACGVAAHALLGGPSIATWAILHSLAALALVLTGRYAVFENIMKVLIGLMVVTILFSVGLIGFDLGPVLRGLVVPTLPSGSSATMLSLMGGVGGSVTMLSYGYWIREKKWSEPTRLKQVRWDLGIGYALTALFGVAMLILASSVLGGSEEGLPEGSKGLVALGDAIRQAAIDRGGEQWAETARLVFLVGVWGAIFTSTLGVWQGVPYLFADYWDAFRGRFGTDVEVRGAAYRGYLVYLAVPPMLLLAVDRPIWVIKTYTVTSGLFMPVLALSLLWLNSRRRWLGGLRNGWLVNALLGIALALFGLIAARKVIDLLA